MSHTRLVVAGSAGVLAFFAIAGFNQEPTVRHVDRQSAAIPHEPAASASRPDPYTPTAAGPFPFPGQRLGPNGNPASDTAEGPPELLLQLREAAGLNRDRLFHSSVDEEAADEAVAQDPYSALQATGAKGKLMRALLANACEADPVPTSAPCSAAMALRGKSSMEWMKEAAAEGSQVAARRLLWAYSEQMSGGPSPHVEASLRESMARVTADALAGDVSAIEELITFCNSAERCASAPYTQALMLHLLLQIEPHRHDEFSPTLGSIKLSPEALKQAHREAARLLSP